MGQNFILSFFVGGGYSNELKCTLLISIAMHISSSPADRTPPYKDTDLNPSPLYEIPISE